MATAPTTTTSSTTRIPSPGNIYTPTAPPMRLPHLEHIYRIVAQMVEDGAYEIPNIMGTGTSRSVIPIRSGSIDGPKIRGKIVEGSGADWAVRVHSKRTYYKLDARYTVLTSDNHHILIHAKGIFRDGPGVPEYDVEPPNTSQDEAEYFSHLTFEAPGDSPYNWMNSIVTVGVMTMWENQVVIDAYRLTNFPGVEVEDTYVGR